MKRGITNKVKWLKLTKIYLYSGSTTKLESSNALVSSGFSCPNPMSLDCSADGDGDVVATTNRFISKLNGLSFSASKVFKIGSLCDEEAPRVITQGLICCCAKTCHDRDNFDRDIDLEGCMFIVVSRASVTCFSIMSILESLILELFQRFTLKFPLIREFLHRRPFKSLQSPVRGEALFVCVCFVK